MIRRGIQLVGNIVMDFVFPPVCLSCGSPVTPQGPGVCLRCLGLIKKVNETDEIYRSTLARLADGGAVDCLIAPWYFEKDGPLQSLIHHLKYSGMTLIGEQLGKMVGERVIGCNLHGDYVIIPVPLHTAKRRERGYNQSEHIGRGVAVVTGWDLESGLLLRRRFTPSQTTLTMTERQSNVRDAFAVPHGYGGRLQARPCLLVDDVVTTGATLHACAATLKKAGAQRVVCCAVALAV